MEAELLILPPYHYGRVNGRIILVLSWRKLAMKIYYKDTNPSRRSDVSSQMISIYLRSIFSPKETPTLLISALLEGHRMGAHKDHTSVRLLIADCFGLLGALDASRFRRNSDEVASQKITGNWGTTTTQVEIFCISFVKELLREFQEAKDTANFDYCAYLIRTVLKEMDVEPTEENEIWKYIDRDQRELILPLLTREDYKRMKVEPGKVVSDLPSPIYLSFHGQTFDTWLTNWLSVLITFVNKKEQKAKAIFEKSLCLIQKNIRIAIFLAPYVVTYAIFCAKSSQRKLIVEEMKTVLMRCTVLEKRKSMFSQPLRDSQSDFGLEDEVEMSVESETVFHSRCTHIVLTILEHLHRFYSFAQRNMGLKTAKEEDYKNSKYRDGRRPNLSPTNLSMTEENMQAVESVLDKIPKTLISEVAFNYRSYATSLFFLEQMLKTDDNSWCPHKLQDNLDYLQRIYVSLDDMDSVAGVAAIRERDPENHEKVLEYVAKGDAENSIRVIEQMSERDPNDINVRKAIIRAYLTVEEPHKALVFIKTSLNDQNEWEIAFQEMQFEALIKLEQWDQLNESVQDLEKIAEKNEELLKDKLLKWKMVVPRVLLRLKTNELDVAMDIMNKFKINMLPSLVAASEEIYPYKRAYLNVVQLHIMTEIEDAIKVLRLTEEHYSQEAELACLQSVTTLTQKWNARLKNVCKSRKVVDEIINVRRYIFGILKNVIEEKSENASNVLSSSIRDCWLGLARDASKCRNFVLADNCLIKAKEHSMSHEVLITEAKILARKGDKVRALAVLDKAIPHFFPQDMRDSWKQRPADSVPEEGQILCAKALLLETKLREDLKQLDRNQYVAKYKETTEIHKASEKNFFTLGGYYDRLWNLVEKKENWHDGQAAIVRYYSQSLLYGCKYVHQSLPRLLSIWFDCSANHMNNSSGSGSSSTSSGSNNGSPHISIHLPNQSTGSQALANMNHSIEKMKDGVPAYVLMSAFSQLISRLCHNNPNTWAILKAILAKIIMVHPHQALWMTLAVYKSVNPARQKRCIQIYDVARSNFAVKKIIKDYKEITASLIPFNDRNFDRPGKFNLRHLAPDLVNRVASLENVMIPFQAFINPTLPPKGVNSNEHHPFPNTQVFIEKLEEQVEVMSSLVKPKKLLFRGTDGKHYALLLKPKDDLRKDSKMMEVNSVVNWYLSLNSEASQRRLRVRTYSVIPLNETCGLLEWVPNLQPLRHILTLLYKEKNLHNRQKDYRNKLLRHLPLQKKREIFAAAVEDLQPVLNEWFFNNFSDHQSWYVARTLYTRTTAVISMIGYIMGLGDRHCENILLDTATGQCVHVDFNCIFNKGETFEWPEKVPFRLTQNIVDAMGPLGVEGVFRRSCEIVMNIFRENQSIFLSILRPFVFDPLVEWDREDKDIRRQKKKKNNLEELESGEWKSTRGVETLVAFSNRLSGRGRAMLRDVDSELSAEALVDYLIKTATSEDNLCQMYPGWMPYQ